MKILKSILKFVLNIFMPRTCHHCGVDLGAQSAAPLCPECMSKARPPGPLICKRCGLTLPSGGATCFNCRGSKVKSYKCSLVRSSFVFTPEVKSLVHNFKYNEHLYLKNFFSREMAKTFDSIKEFKNIDMVCAVPLHNFRFRKRGYNQSAVLAQRLAELRSLTYAPKLLKRVKRTPSQTKLGRKERIENVKNAFAVKEDVKGKTVLLIDDVATTCSTLEACANVLKQAGAKKIYALTLAREE